MLNAVDIRDPTRGGTTSQLPEQPHQKDGRTSAMRRQKKGAPVQCWQECKSVQPLWKQ